MALVGRLYGPDNASVSSRLQAKHKGPPREDTISPGGLFIVEREQGSGRVLSFREIAPGGDLDAEDAVPAIEPEIPGIAFALQVEMPGAGDQ